MPSRKELLDKIRAKIAARKGGGSQKDPDEWRPPKVGPNDTFKAKAFVLPPYAKGDELAGGEAETSMDEVFFIQTGLHWINKRPYPCPRVFDNDDCPMCNLGFKLFQETSDKDARKEIARNYLPNTKYAVNLYFPDTKTNPEELRGKVVYFNAPKTIYDIMEDCIIKDDDGGDPDDPQAWGEFYKPDAAYPLIIEIKHKGGFNDYSMSKFLPKAQAIAKSEKDLEAILAQRHELAKKFPERTKKNLETLSSKIDELLGRSSSDDDDSGFDHDESDDSSSTEETTSTSEEETEVKKESKSSDEETSVLEEDDEEISALLKKIETGNL